MLTIAKLDHQLNEEIRDKEIRLIGADGAQLGIMSSAEANAMAEEQGMDLVKISPNAVPPVCKIMDYSKFCYDQKKREKDAKKNQKVVEIKEIRMSPSIDTNDLNTKIKSALKFLGEPIVNCSEAFFDDYIQANAAARTRAGMTVRIVRTLGPAEVRPYRTKNNRMRLYRVPCAYCQSLAGVHEFTTLSEGAYLFARHEACRCIISYTNAKNPSASITRPLWER